METFESVMRRFVDSVTGMDGRGQDFLTRTGLLPAEIEPEGARETFEACGVRFLGSSHDPLFVEVVLPGGWKKVSSGHPYLTMLVDNQGRERARIFYKPADYGRVAALTLVPRYGIFESCYGIEGFEVPTAQEFMVCVTDGGVVLDDRKVIYDTEVIELVGSRFEKFRAARALIKKGEAWLDANFPDWQNPFAYWG